MNIERPSATAGTIRAEFLRLLTEDGPTPDRRRRDHNQALFMADGQPVWTEIDLSMVMEKYDRAVRNTTNAPRR